MKVTKILLLILFVFVFQYYVMADNQVPTDPDWTIVDESTNNAKTSLNTVINGLIGSGKKKIFIKNGVYHLNDKIVIDQSDITIMGQSRENTKLIQDNTQSNTIEVYRVDYQVERVTVSDLNIDNRKAKIAFWCKNVNYITLKNCNVYGSNDSEAVTFYGKVSTDDVATVESGNLDEGNSINGNQIYYDLAAVNVNDGIIFSKQKGGIVKDNLIYGSRIAFYLNRNSEVSNNTISDSKTNGIRCTVPAYDNKINNNIIRRTTYSGITVVSEAEKSIRETYRAQNIQIMGNKIYDSRYFGIETGNLKASIIEGNTIDEIDYAGIYLLYSDSVKVQNNYISNVGLSKERANSSGWTEDGNSGIFLDYMVTKCDVYSNQIKNVEALHQDGRFGVRIQGDESNKENNITYNIIEGYFEYGTSMRTGSPINNIDEHNTFIRYPKTSPTNISAVADFNKITVTWDSMTAVQEYYIEVDGVEINNGNSTSYIHNGIMSGTNHVYRVRAKGGPWSAQVNATTLGVPIPASIEAKDLALVENTTTNAGVVVKDKFNNIISNGYILKYSIPTNDRNIAEVDESGKVTAKAYVEGANTTTLTIDIEGTSVSETIVITVSKVDPAPVDPTPVDPPPVDPTPVDPPPVDPPPVDPPPVDPAPVDPAPVDPAPVDPAPVDPEPVDPAPVDPAPVDPAPVDPAPVDPAPVDPAPVDPAPVDPGPVDPAPVDPEPVDPAPVDPAPVDPEPVDPAPVDPAPVDSVPVDPTPVDPPSVDPIPTPVDPAPIDPSEELPTLPEIETSDVTILDEVIEPIPVDVPSPQVKTPTKQSKLPVAIPARVSSSLLTKVHPAVLPTKKIEVAQPQETGIQQKPLKEVREKVQEKVLPKQQAESPKKIEESKKENRVNKFNILIAILCIIGLIVIIRRKFLKK